MDKKLSLELPHIQPLIHLVHQWRDETGLDVPFFDPDDGGINARILFLLEKPGPGAATKGGSGFISQDNEDPTARAIKQFMAEAGIPRSAALLWNTISAWNGTRRIRAREREDAAKQLHQLTQELSQLRVIVLVGKEAQRAFEKIQKIAPDLLGRYHIFRCTHPSPINRARRYSEWSQIPDCWKKAWFLACDPDSRYLFGA